MGNEPIKRGVLNFMDISILKPWNSETLKPLNFLTTEAQRTQRNTERERSGEGAIGRGKEGETKRPNNCTIEVPNP